MEGFQLTPSEQIIHRNDPGVPGLRTRSAKKDRKTERKAGRQNEFKESYSGAAERVNLTGVKESYLG